MSKPGNGNGERPTMEMVAALAGVSKITVSRALRGSDLVRPEPRERIAKIAGEAGYRMNVAARSLRPRRTQTVAVAIYDAVESGNNSLALTLVIVVSVVALIILTIANRLEPAVVRR